ncbi:unnamed protein product [Merluccius merluccius]
MEGGNRSVVAQVDRPKAIIVDLCYGATLGGNYRLSIINSSLSSPSGLTLDVEEWMLYWADSTLDARWGPPPGVSATLHQLLSNRSHIGAENLALRGQQPQQEPTEDYEKKTA